MVSLSVVINCFYLWLPDLLHNAACELCADRDHINYSDHGKVAQHLMSSIKSDMKIIRNQLDCQHCFSASAFFILALVRLNYYLLAFGAKEIQYVLV